jgi:oxygen-independent coproporphyrinogen-3 oxidase
MGLIPAFLDALLRDISATAAAAKEAGLRPVAVISAAARPRLSPPPSSTRCCAAMARDFDLSACRELTVRRAGRTPITAEEKLGFLRAHGVSRVSVNPQTMSDRVLEASGAGTRRPTCCARWRSSRRGGTFR